jgi:hypothetical protein
MLRYSFSWTLMALTSLCVTSPPVVQRIDPVDYINELTNAAKGRPVYVYENGTSGTSSSDDVVRRLPPRYRWLNRPATLRKRVFSTGDNDNDDDDDDDNNGGDIDAEEGRVLLAAAAAASSAALVYAADAAAVAAASQSAAATARGAKNSQSLSELLMHFFRMFGFPVGSIVLGRF